MDYKSQISYLKKKMGMEGKPSAKGYIFEHQLKALRHPKKSSLLKIGGIILFSIAVLVAHYQTPAETPYFAYHALYQRILYIPILFASFWFGLRGGILSSIFVGISYFPHIMHDWGGHLFTSNTNQTLEIVMYVVVGVLTGALIDLLRRNEESLLRSNIQLEAQSRQLRDYMEKLTEKTNELFATEEQLRRSDRLAALGQLTAGLAHEIRNPLASIDGAAEILSDPNIDQEQRQKFGRIMAEATEQMNHVLSNFLSYARTERAENAEEGNLGPALAKALSLLDRQMQSQSVKAVSALPEEMPTLAIPQNLLEQMLLNLLLNAVQAMPNGGNIRIERLSARDKNLLQIAISDTGPGIPKDQAHRIFDPFYTTRTQGTGLGLSIVHKIISIHGGAIELDSDYGRGARFIISLPTSARIRE